MLNPTKSKWWHFIMMPNTLYEGKNWLIKHGYECKPSVNKFTGEYNTSGIPIQFDGIRAYAMDKNLKLLRNDRKEVMPVAMCKVRDRFEKQGSLFLLVTNNDPALTNEFLDEVFVHRWTPEPIVVPDYRPKIAPDTRDYMKYDNYYKRKK